jgi:hypothetical protein
VELHICISIRIRKRKGKGKHIQSTGHASIDSFLYKFLAKMQNGILLCDDHVKVELKFLASFFSFFLSKSTF